MDTDDVMPNDGEYFLPREPREQVIARKKEQAQVLEAKKVIEQVLSHFEERIMFRDSLESINIDLEKDPALHQKMCEVNEMLKLALVEEKNLLVDLLDTNSR